MTAAVLMTASPDSSRLVAVTGASGHVGANLVRALLERGHPVRALVRESRRGIAGLAVESIAVDVCDRRTLAAAFADVATVYHLAARLTVGTTAGAAVHQVNVEGTRNVVAACRAAGVRRLVHFSSIEACARRPDAGPLDESCPLVPLAHGHPVGYGRSKAEADRIVLGAAAAGLDVVILHPTAIVGPCDFQPSPMGEVLLALARGRMPALLRADCDFVDVRDVAAAAIAAATRGRRGERYLLSGTRLSLRELARRWAAVTDCPAPRFAAPLWLAGLAAPFAPAWARLRGRRPLFTCETVRVLRDFPTVDRSKAELELGYRPRALDETLRDTWTWIRQEGRA